MIEVKARPKERMRQTENTAPSQGTPRPRATQKAGPPR